MLSDSGLTGNLHVVSSKDDSTSRRELHARRVALAGSPFATSHAIGRGYAANVPSASPSFVHDLKPTELDRSRKTHCTLGFVCNLQRR